MTKLRQNKLFGDNEIYCLDTSAIINLLKKYPPEYKHSEKPLAVIDELIKLGNILIPEEVFLELSHEYHSESTANSWIKKYKKFITPNAEHFSLVSGILKKYPQIHNFEKKHKYDADVFVVAVARNTGAIVVTSESSAGEINLKNLQPGSLKIPGLCDLLKKHKCINCDEFADKIYLRS